MIYKNVIINPDPYLLPGYKLSPFGAGDIARNASFVANGAADEWFGKRFGNDYFYYTTNGRKALNIALSQLGLSPADEVAILTTSGSFYISSCVTGEIGKFCAWSREITGATKAILVNHEFGFPYQDLKALKKYGLPIIEDCAYSFLSDNEEASVGQVGDYVIYSFPKFFPLQIGGLLRSRKEIGNISVDADTAYTRQVLDHHIGSVNEFAEKRIENYTYLCRAFDGISIKPYFGLANQVVPGAFIFRLPKHIQAEDLKKYMYANGVECSIFYKEHSLFIPCHHKLHTADLDYFVTVVEYYLENNKEI